MKLATATVAATAFILCTGFTAAPKSAPCPYTKQVIVEHAEFDTPSSAPTAHAREHSNGDDKGFLNLRLHELAWKPAQLVSKLADWEVAIDIQEKFLLVSNLVVVNPIRWIAGMARTAINVAAKPVIALAPSRTPAETAVMAHNEEPKLKRNRKIMEGRLPSLARSMESTWDPAMGLDDMERSAETGFQFGLRLERALHLQPKDPSLELHVMVPGL